MNSSNRPGWAKTISVISVLACLFGCQYDPWANRFLKSGPKDADIVGTYQLDADTLSRHISVPESKTLLSVNPSAQVVLSADHGAEFVEVPDWIYDHGSSLCVISGAGSWKFGKNDDYSVIWVEIQRRNFRAGVDHCGSTYNGELFLYGKKPPYKLHITIGDPDSGDAVQLEKIK